MNSYSVPDPEKRKRIVNKTVSAFKEFTSVAPAPQGAGQRVNSLKCISQEEISHKRMIVKLRHLLGCINKSWTVGQMQNRISFLVSFFDSH